VTGNSTIAPAVTPRRCQLKFVNQTGLTQYIYPRYGWFNRDHGRFGCGADLQEPVGPLRLASPWDHARRTYTEEIQNYAKWYTYYRTACR